jgi:hypothetical protein
VFTFPCPHCSVPLRVRDAGMRDRTIACPDCGKPLVIREHQGSLHAEAVRQQPSRKDQRKARKQRTDRPPPATSTAGTQPAIPYPHTSRLPRILAIGTSGLLLVVILWISFSGRGEDAAPPPADPHEPPLLAEEEPQPDERADEPEPEPAPEIASAEEQLLRIHQYIAEHHEARNLFPRGTIESDQPEPSRFSWIAAIRRANEPHNGGNFQRPWNDPQNDEFVRRRFPEFENPQIEQVAGEDRYPATHFVGVTGVGADSATIPKHHPRAGIFGIDRRTSVEDVKDGLAHTMLVAGVQDRLGSWARSGPATIRGFTAEPYVNGPDGFGTGQPDGMYVLMADGSVRFLSKETDPVIVRRMAAMADGLPLDSSVPGDPLAMTLPPDPPAEEPDPMPEDPPIEVPIAPDRPRFDIARSLQQEIRAYAQQQPLPLHVVLYELEELLGAPIDLSEIPEDVQSREVKVELEEVTLAEILDAVTEAAGVRFETEPGRIVVHPAPPNRERNGQGLD